MLDKENMLTTILTESFVLPWGKRLALKIIARGRGSRTARPLEFFLAAINTDTFLA